MAKSLRLQLPQLRSKLSVKLMALIAFARVPLLLNNLSLCIHFSPALEFLPETLVQTGRIKLYVRLYVCVQHVSGTIIKMGLSSSLGLCSPHRFHRRHQDALRVCGHPGGQRTLPGHGQVQLHYRTVDGTGQHCPVRSGAAGDCVVPEPAKLAQG